MLFWKKKAKTTCLHSYVLNGFYTHYVNSGFEVQGEERYILFCTNCKRNKTVDQFDYNKMKRLGLIKG